MMKGQSNTQQYLMILVLVLIVVGIVYLAFTGVVEDARKALSGSGEDADKKTDKAASRAECYEKYNSQSRIDSCLARVGS